MASDPSDAVAAFVPIRQPRSPRQGCSSTLCVVVTLALLAPASPGHPADAAEAPARDVFEAEDDEASRDVWQEAPAEADVLLPADRALERVLDRAKKLVADQRWSDAAATLDELLAVEQDAFAVGGTTATRSSIRSEAAALVEQLPRAGHETYERLFGGRADRHLMAAIAADDAVAVVAVARRWLHTPAGRQAAMLAAIRALEGGQPLAASAWLDRLARMPSAAAVEP
ncbi:MAG: hypothetical protein FJ284_15900, partial [Planctomycetes bacterium]|nr:hypothetical protein [Planctomycetota bacterium]